MAKKTVIKSEPRKVIEFGKHGVTKEKTIQEVEEIRSFRRENTSVFNILTSVSTYLIIFFGLLFASSIEFYQDDPESMQWIDSNGDFKTETYDLTVSYNLDTPLDDLNGYSLKQVFETYNLSLNYDYNSWGTEGADKTTDANGNIVIVTSIDLYYFFNAFVNVGNASSTYYNLFTFDTVSENLDIQYRSLPSGYVTVLEDLEQGQNSFVFVNDVIRFRVIDLTSELDESFSFYWNAFIDLGNLGINQTADEMDYWYSEYQRLNQGNMLEDLKTLGAMPLASWNTMNQVTRTLIDVYEYGMKLVFPIVDVVRRLITLV